MYGSASSESIPNCRVARPRQRPKSTRRWSLRLCPDGDMPYSPADSVRFGRLVEAINRAEGLEWVVHVGDIKGGSSPCSDGLLQSRFEWFQQFARPFILAPGDNDWTDCHRSGYRRWTGWRTCGHSFFRGRVGL